MNRSLAALFRSPVPVPWRFLFLLLVGAHPGLSFGSSAPNYFQERLAPAFRNLEEKGKALIGSQDQRLLTDAAYASVAASACKGLKFRPGEVDRRFSLIVDRKASESKGSKQTLSVQVSTLYGAYLGLFISESYLDPSEFCKGVEKVRTSKGGATQFWENP